VACAASGGTPRRDVHDTLIFRLRCFARISAGILACISIGIFARTFARIVARIVARTQD